MSDNYAPALGGDGLGETRTGLEPCLGGMHTELSRGFHLFIDEEEVGCWNTSCTSDISAPAIGYDFWPRLGVLSRRHDAAIIKGAFTTNSLFELGDHTFGIVLVTSRANIEMTGRGKIYAVGQNMSSSELVYTYEFGFSVAQEEQ